jgi:hypothetical protein
MAAKNQGNGGEMQYGDDDASRKRIRKENGVRRLLIVHIFYCYYYHLADLILFRKLRSTRQLTWQSASSYKPVMRTLIAWSTTK